MASRLAGLCDSRSRSPAGRRRLRSRGWHSDVRHPDHALQSLLASLMSPCPDRPDPLRPKRLSPPAEHGQTSFKCGDFVAPPETADPTEAGPNREHPPYGVSPPRPVERVARAPKGTSQASTGLPARRPSSPRRSPVLRLSVRQAPMDVRPRHFAHEESLCNVCAL